MILKIKQLLSKENLQKIKRINTKISKKYEEYL